MKPWGALFIVLAVLAVLTPGPALAAELPGSGISGGTTAGGFVANGGTSGRGQTGGNGDPGGTAGPAVRTVDCGAPAALGHVITGGGDPCAVTRNRCAGQPATNAAGKALTTQVTQTQLPDGSWSNGGSSCSVAGATAVVDPAAVQAAFVKLLPTVGIGAAPATGRELVNVQALYWVNTAAQLNLGTQVLVGHQVNLTASVQTVTWGFGDGATAASSTPGRVFTRADYCDTAQCPGFFGHTYTSTGPMTVTAVITWTGTYSVDGGPAITIPTTVTTTPNTLPVTVYQARAVLLPN